MKLARRVTRGHGRGRAVAPVGCRSRSLRPWCAASTARWCRATTSARARTSTTCARSSFRTTGGPRRRPISCGRPSPPTARRPICARGWPRSCLTLGRIDEAREEIEASLHLDGQFAEAYVDMARVRLRLGDAGGAEAALKRGHRGRPHLRRRLRAAGEPLSRARAGRQGAGDLARAGATHVPSSAPAHHALARAAVTRGDWKTAEGELQKALELDGNLGEAREELAELYQAEGRVRRCAGVAGRGLRSLGRRQDRRAPGALADGDRAHRRRARRRRAARGRGRRARSQAVGRLALARRASAGACAYGGRSGAQGERRGRCASIDGARAARSSGSRTTRSRSSARCRRARRSTWRRRRSSGACCATAGAIARRSIPSGARSCR